MGRRADAAPGRERQAVAAPDNGRPAVWLLTPTGIDGALTPSIGPHTFPSTQPPGTNTVTNPGPWIFP